METSSTKKDVPNTNNETTKDNKTRARDRSSGLRIVFIEPSGGYCRRVWCAVGATLTQVMIGATTIVTLMYSMGNDDAHASLCSIAYHFFTAEAILSLNYANGWSTPMRLRHRRFAHVFLQMSAMVCAITGTVLITIAKGVSTSVHGLTGFITTIMAVISFLSGACALFYGRYWKIIHVSFGIPTFIMSSICFSFGLYTPAFKKWVEPAVANILLFAIVFYTLFITATCFVKCLMKI